MQFFQIFVFFKILDFYLIKLLNKKSEAGATFRLQPRDLKFCMVPYNYPHNGKNWLAN